MKKYFFGAVILLTFFAHSQNKQFTKNALKEVVLSVNNEEISFQKIVEKYKGTAILIDFWASWCPDCVKGLPKVKKLQAQFPQLRYVFLSVDRKIEKWKNGIKKYDIKGGHYFIKSGWKKSTLCKEIKLDWIPGYMLLDKTGKIYFFRAITADDPKLINAIKELI